MHFNKKRFNNDILDWENDLKKRKFIAKNTVKGSFYDLVSIIKIVFKNID
ncbi:MULTISPECIES: hypothetical protein [Periweissella]|uniref:Uncharacterized protein n=1 Tax=Periweissella fabalis TaxID=1070421 RepID=A0A7X6N6M4_9LACO|nr:MULTISPECIES: hypothetical protein [Periweissella]MCM0598348.1 hypothetical protein [Periweissella fabalis]NKZ24970.1 hypothetical protein [Periweissella fabalis]